MSQEPVKKRLALRADEILLEQYKIYAQERDRYIRARHEHARFFITALFTEALLGVLGITFFKAASATLSNFQLLVLFAVGFYGVITCIFWSARDTLMLYKLGAKSCVIQEMEQSLAYPCDVKQHEYYEQAITDNMSTLGKRIWRTANKLSDKYFPCFFAIPYVAIIIYWMAYGHHF